MVGKLISIGGAACSVDIYYGTSDQNESTGDWQNSLSLDQFFQGFVPVTLTELNSGETYYYRFRANNGNTAWSDVGIFSTLPYDQGTLRIHTGSDGSGSGAGWFWDKGLGDG